MSKRTRDDAEETSTQEPVEKKGKGQKTPSKSEAYIEYIEGRPDKLYQLAKDNPHAIDWNFEHNGTNLALTYIHSTSSSNEPLDHAFLSNSILHFSSLNFAFAPQKDGRVSGHPLVILILKNRERITSLSCQLLLEKFENGPFFDSIKWDEIYNGESAASLVAFSVLSKTTTGDTDEGYDLPISDQLVHSTKNSRLLLTTLEKLVHSHFNPIKDNEWSQRSDAKSPMPMQHATHLASRLGLPPLLNKLLTLPSSILEKLPWTSAYDVMVGDYSNKRRTSSPIQDLAYLFERRNVHPSTFVLFARLETSVLEALQRALTTSFQLHQITKQDCHCFDNFLNILSTLKSCFTLTSSGKPEFKRMEMDKALEAAESDDDDEESTSKPAHPMGFFCVAKKIEQWLPADAENYYRQIQETDGIYLYSIAQHELAKLHFSNATHLNRQDSPENKEHKGHKKSLELRKALTAAVTHWYCEIQRFEKLSLSWDETACKELITKITDEIRQRPLSLFENTSTDWSAKSTTSFVVNSRVTNILQEIRQEQLSQQIVTLTGRLNDSAERVSLQASQQQQRSPALSSSSSAQKTPSPLISASLVGQRSPASGRSNSAQQTRFPTIPSLDLSGE